MRVCRVGPHSYRIEVDGALIDVSVEPAGQFECWLTTWWRARSHVVSVDQGSSFRIEVDGVSHRIDRDDGGIVRAPAPAVVVSIAVSPGDMVEAGDRLAVTRGHENGDADRGAFLRPGSPDHCHS